MSPIIRFAILAGTTTSSARASIKATDLFTLGTPDGFDYASPDGDHAARGGQVVGSATNSSMGGANHAILWTAAAPSGIDLHSDAYELGTTAMGTTGTQQVGYGYTADNTSHALLWSGTADSVRDLTPAGYGDAIAFDAVSGQQVGAASINGGTHALLWSGTADSYRDLGPAGYDYSFALGTDGTTQVGYAFTIDATAPRHAFLWHGTASSAVDLQPANFDATEARAAGGDQQVGVGSVANSLAQHALLWTGSADSVVDLTPDAANAVATDTNGHFQVGYESADVGWDALLWSGTADSVVHLGTFLPTAWTSSQAYSITGDTIFGTAVDADGNLHAVAWTVPEPATVLTLTLLTVAARRRRTHRSR